MRQSLVFVGIGALVIIIGLMINQRFTSPSDNKDTKGMSSLTLTSSAFVHEGTIPQKYTCDGAESSPPLTISGAPEGTKSYALIVEDRDVPKQFKPDGIFVHWIVYNIPANISEIPESAVLGVPGGNSTGQPAYMGPCPPTDIEPLEHRYVFTLYALDSELQLSSGAAKGMVLEAIQGHSLAEAKLIGKYKRQ